MASRKPSFLSLVLKLTKTTQFTRLYSYTFRPSGMAVDWLSDNLYWTDEDLGLIVVSRLGGRFPHILAQNVGRPRGIDVNPETGSVRLALSFFLFGQQRFTEQILVNRHV